MKNIVLIGTILSILTPTLSLAERNLTVYTIENGETVADEYNSRELDMNDSGRYMFNSGPGQNVRITHGALDSQAIAITDMQFLTTSYVISPEFNKLIESEANIDASPDGKYVALRPNGPQEASRFSSESSPLYLYNLADKSLVPIIKSYDGSELTGCTNQWADHNWSRSSVTYWSNEVIYHSDCDNIVENDTNGSSDLFVYDINTGTNKLLTQVINVNGSLTQANGSNESPEASDSGQFIVFASKSKNLEATPCPGNTYQVYVLDRVDGSYTRISECEDGRANVLQLGYGISGDGSVVAHNGQSFFDELQAKTTMRIYNTSTKQVENVDSFYRRGRISVSYDGNIFAFISNRFFYEDTSRPSENISSFGAVTTWKRDTNTLITRAHTYTDKEPAPDVFTHDKVKISAAGDFVFFAGSTSAYWKEQFIQTDNSFHEFIGNEFTRNSRFITIRGTHNNWASLSNMRLIGNNLWQGEIVTNHQSTEFKFDITGDWNENYGDNNNDGIGDSDGNNILISNGPGVYSVTFNDTSKAYTINPVTTPVLDQHLNTAKFICSNGLTHLGQSVYVVGNTSSLGNWDPAHAMILNSENYPTWEADLAVPTNTNIEWKCLKRNENNPVEDIIWQSGNNNSFNSSSSNTSNGSF